MDFDNFVSNMTEQLCEYLNKTHGGIPEDYQYDGQNFYKCCEHWILHAIEQNEFEIDQYRTN